jgi:DNA-binding CsgD family transcriptional regulator
MRESEQCGMSIRATAQAMGISPKTVQKKLREIRQKADAELPDGEIYIGKNIGLDGRVRPDRRIDTTRRDDAIIALHLSGASLRSIATEMKCSVGTVHRVIHSGHPVSAAQAAAGPMAGVSAAISAISSSSSGLCSRTVIPVTPDSAQAR